MRDRAQGVDEIVAWSNAVVLRESKPVQHVPLLEEMSRKLRDT